MNWKARLALVVLAVSTNLPGAFAQSSGASSAEQASSSPAVAQTQSRKAMRAADRKLAKAVRYAIEHQKGLDATRIAIVARNGNVTLTGSVPDASQVDVAAQQAKSVAGVSAVVNRLAVGEIAP
jgi:hyperosmotically inducible periplasmic protein